ncbi:vomeronasal type-1 receptor 54-like [Psammomys obesus]|uniref:vomeronasal type-1 receptor 54-like n=1 Tax=Psammomys obesus TaxID=48139 RepID=UPI002452E7F2|nr:vomeronasal type-1 receptor 54-like [Psammomys obesus]
MNKIHEVPHKINLRNILYFEAGIGLSGNIILLLFQVLKFIRGQRLRLTDPPISLLALIHLLMMLVMSLVASDIFMPGKRWSVSTCKFVMFLYRSFRSLSLCATSLLSILQAITLSSRSSCLAKFKCKSPHHMLGCLLFLSIFYSSFSSPLKAYITVTPNLTSPGFTYLTQSCCLAPMRYYVWQTFYTLLALRDVIFVALLTISSAYMVTFLYRHKKQSQFLHSTNRSPISSPEHRATRTILCLMSFFVVMYTSDSVITYFRYSSSDLILYFVVILVGHSYATVSPFLVLSTEKHVIHILKCYGRTVDI